MTEEIEKLKVLHRERAAKVYTITLNCHNCGKDAKHELPWGQLVMESNATCPNCGCTNEQVEEGFKRKNAGSPLAGPQPYMGPR